MSSVWNWLKIPRGRVQGRNIAEDNFASEKRTLLEIFIREAIQNPLDARREDAEGPVEVRFRYLGPSAIDSGYLASLADGDYFDRLAASRHPQGTPPLPQGVLTVEDFNTTGLEGETGDPNVDGAGQNWNAFWFREGEGAKASPGSNGRAGQGKITYYRMSEMRAIFGLTVRQSDGKRLLMGRSSFRKNYAHAGQSDKFERDAFWSLPEQAPETDASSLDDFAKAFALCRSGGESGFSVVVPAVASFDEAIAVRTAISDFYFPIARGRLRVVINDQVVDADSLDRLASKYFPDEAAKAVGSAFSSGFREFVKSSLTIASPDATAKADWNRPARLDVQHFEEGVVKHLREKVASGQPILVRFPLRVRPRGGLPAETWLDAYLQVPDELEAPEEAYIRRDLLIGHERQLRRARHLPPARGLTFIDHRYLSAFLADAEEPTHLSWNASRPRLEEDYERPKETVSAVRHAMPRLLELIGNVVSRRDTKALAFLFSKPMESGAAKLPGGQRPQQKLGAAEEKRDVPLTKAKPFRWRHGDTWESVSASSLGDLRLPVDATLEFAYLGVDDDAFAAYDPFDFDLADGRLHPLGVTGGEVISRTRNQIRVRITEAPFSLQVGGFDSNLRRRMRIDYQEAEHAEEVSSL